MPREFSSSQYILKAVSDGFKMYCLIILYSAVSNCTSFHLPVSVAKISAISCNYYKKRPINRGPQTSPYSYFTPITTPLLHTHTHTHTHTLRTPLFHAPIISHRVVLLKENKEKCLLQKIFQKRFFE